MNSKRTISVDAEPYDYEFEPAHCALVIIDMQRDFLEPGGFGEMLGNDVSQLRRTIEPNRQLLATWRGGGFEGDSHPGRASIGYDRSPASQEESGGKARLPSAIPGRWAEF